MKTELHPNYHTLLSKYRKFRIRYEKQVKNGSFHFLSGRKKQIIISRIKRILAQLERLRSGLRYGAATAAIGLMFPMTSLEAQTFVQITGAANPFNGITVGANSNPTFVDIDGDGDKDAFIGDATT